MLYLLSFHFSLQAQQIFTENFSGRTLGPSWMIVTGSWKVANVQDLKIAPAENGNQYVLCAEGPGIIRLIIDIPDTIKATKLQLQFSYYTYIKGAGASIEIEFHKRDQKDGSKGKLFTASLPVKGRWMVWKKLMLIPSGANSVYFTFTAKKSTTAAEKVCFDVIQAFAVK